MRLRKFPTIHQRNEKRALKAMRTYATSGRIAALLFLFLFLLAQLVGQYHNALPALKGRSSLGAILLSEKYNDIVNVYHSTIDAVTGADFTTARETVSSRPSNTVSANRINPAEADKKPGQDAAPTAERISGVKENASDKNDSNQIAQSETYLAAKVMATVPTLERVEAARPPSQKHTEGNPQDTVPSATNRSKNSASIELLPGASNHKTQNHDHVRENKVVDAKQKWKSSKPEIKPETQATDAVTDKAKTLAEHLNFSEKTAINYMHFHKTGGVSFKTALFEFFLDKKKRNGEPVHVRDACYMRKVQATGSVPSFDRWRCDWDPVWEMTEAERNKLDVVFGHQYWVNGAEAFLNRRDMRTFTVIRHPFDRKVSFFFHFFVRERNRDETKIEFAEVRDFLLYDKIRDSSLELGKDLGPNYMAGRLLSDGFDGYVGNAFQKYYEVRAEEKSDVAERALKIMRKYSFIGLQSESDAAKCMLRKMVDVFNAAHGIINPMTENVARTAKVLNTGAYSLTASKIWERLSLEERALFDRNERVDLAIYKEGERLFKEQVRIFQCQHLVKRKQLLAS